jgi:hypothetical protein
MVDGAYQFYKIIGSEELVWEIIDRDGHCGDPVGSHRPGTS